MCVAICLFGEEGVHVVPPAERSPAKVRVCDLDQSGRGWGDLRVLGSLPARGPSTGVKIPSKRVTRFCVSLVVAHSDCLHARSRGQTRVILPTHISSSSVPRRGDSCRSRQETFAPLKKFLFIDRRALNSSTREFLGYSTEQVAA